MLDTYDPKNIEYVMIINAFFYNQLPFLKDEREMNIPYCNRDLS